MRFYYFLILFVFIIATNVHAQKKSVVICPDDLLYKSFIYAKNNQYFKAKNVLYGILQSHPKCGEALSRLVDLSYRTNDTFYAFQYSKQLMELNPDKGVQTITALLETMKEFGDEALGLRLMQAVMQDTKKIESSKMQKIDTLLQVASNKQNLLNAPVTDMPIKMNANINTNTTQCFPSLTLDGQKLYFTKVVNDLNEDFYVSEQADTCSGWALAVPLGSPPNTSGPDGASQISADGNYLFFTKCDQRSQNGYDGGGCDVFFCYKTTDGWSSPEKFKSTINSMHYEGQPCINSLNNELYFVSDRKGGYGGKDIYKSKFVNGLWQEPINLGSKINTKYDDESPFIHPDNETLYFVSRNLNGLGGQDIYVSRKIKDSLWLPAKNLGYPINSEVNENSMTIAANGKDIIIASNRNNVKGAYSLYTALLPAFARAQPTHCVQGKLFDKLSKDILTDMEIEVLDSNGKLIQKCKTNIGDASFTFPLKAGSTYYYTIGNVVDYKAYKQEINLHAENKMPALIQSDAYIKISDGIDTLYQATFFGSENQDTTLFHITHDVQNWHTQVVDSIVLECTLTYNSFIDTAWLQQVCTTDSLRMEYLQEATAKQKLQQQEIFDYFNFYNRYLEQKKMPIKNYIMRKKEDVWQGKERYKLDITAIEYY
jgi:hypothetical protein